MDTPSKRFSAIHIALPFRGAGYIPDGTTDRQAVAFLYEGISAVPPAPPVPTAKPGGIGHGKKQRYPKRVSIDGRIYVVKSVAEEREILEEIAAKTREQAAILKALGDNETAVKVEKKATIAQKRVDATAIAYAAWMAKLLQDDEEILLIAA